MPIDQILLKEMIANKRDNTPGISDSSSSSSIDSSSRGGRFIAVARSRGSKGQHRSDRYGVAGSSSESESEDLDDMSAFILDDRKERD